MLEISILGDNTCLLTDRRHKHMLSAKHLADSKFFAVLHGCILSAINSRACAVSLLPQESDGFNTAIINKQAPSRSICLLLYLQYLVQHMLLS